MILITNSFYSDKPIETEDSDDLGVTNFSDRLATSITNWSGDTLVLGICGDWGSGKTSIINLTLKKIKNLDKKDLIIIKFNPWLFSDRNQIMKKFFDTLIVEIKDTNVSDELKKYAKKIIPGILTISGILAPGSTKTLIDISKYAEEQKTVEENLESIKEKINTTLEGKLVVIVIDDIDRLENDEIQIIFQLVNKLADFSNFIYLLSFDKNVVEKALTEKSFDGSEYLKKIVQIIIDIPTISNIELKYLFIKYLKELVELPETDEKELKITFDVFLKYYFKNIRDIKRYMNNIKFTFDLVKDDVNLYDFLVISTIQIFSPDVYRKIYLNKEVFIVTSDQLYSDSYSLTKQREIYDNIIKNESIPMKSLEKGLSAIFPKIDYLDDKFAHSNIAPLPELVITKQIQYEEHFETYFKLGVPYWELSKIEFNNVLDSIKDLDDFHNNFNSLEYNKKIRFLDIIEKNIKEHAIDVEAYKTPISDNDLTKLVEYYILKGYKLSNLVFRKMKDISVEYIKQDPDLELVKKIIPNVENPISLVFLIEFLENEPVHKKALDDVVNLCVAKIIEYLKNKGLKDLKEPIFILSFMKEKGGKDELEEFTKQINDDNLMLFINSLAHSPTSSHILTYVNDLVVTEDYNLNDFLYRISDIELQTELKEYEIDNINIVKKSLNQQINSTKKENP